ASVIKSAPHSDQAYEAHDWLIHLYLRSGAYRRLISHVDDRWAAFPDKPEREQERTALAPFRGLPDQINGKRRQSILRHENGEIFIPLVIDGTPATYFFDTGGWLSCMS